MIRKTLFILLILILTPLIYAEEAPKYNFGSMQSDKELQISPGNTIETKLYFYNIYGTRITHIALSIQEAPKNWKIEIDPPSQERKVEVSGLQTTVTENLYIEPSESVEEIPTDIPEGIEYIPSKVGYIPAKPVTIKITVPKNENLGKVSKISIEAIASWLGQTGTVSLKQGRNFEYTIKVISKEFSEKILESPEKSLTQITGATIKETIIHSKLLYGIITLLVIIVILLIILFFKRKGDLYY